MPTRAARAESQRWGGEGEQKDERSRWVERTMEKAVIIVIITITVFGPPSSKLHYDAAAVVRDLAPATQAQAVRVIISNVSATSPYAFPTAHRRRQMSANSNKHTSSPGRNNYISLFSLFTDTLDLYK